MQDVGKQLYIQRGAPPLRQARLSLQAGLIAVIKNNFFLPVHDFFSRLQIHNSPVLARLAVTICVVLLTSDSLLNLEGLFQRVLTFE